MLIRCSAAIAAVILLSSPALAEGIKLTDPQIAQPDAFKRTTLQTIDFPPGYETVSVIAELQPGNCTGRHTHPGAESAYVLEGEAVAKFDGKKDLMVKAGQPLLFAPGVVHTVCNFSGRPFKALAHYIVEKGKPLASPAP
jgi:quercetin dioxygenase-like cupin family protein